MRPRTRWKRLVRWVTALWRGNPRGWDDYAPSMARTLEQFNQGEQR